jgi:hypothetical protein
LWFLTGPDGIWEFKTIEKSVFKKPTVFLFGEMHFSPNKIARINHFIFDMQGSEHHMIGHFVQN